MLSHERIVQRFTKLHKQNRRYLWMTLILLLLAFALSLCFRTVVPSFMPKNTAVNLFHYARFGLSQLLGTSYYLEKDAVIDTLSYYGESVIRLKISAFTVAAGMGLGLAGAIFQQVYQNPIASPTTIGAASGVKLGNMAVVLLFSSAAAQMVLYRYVLCLIFTGVIMAAVLIVGRFLGNTHGNYSVLEMLMFGSILSRLISSFVTYWMYNLSGAGFLTYQQIDLGVYTLYTKKSMLLFFVIIAACLLPLLKMRFRLNAVSMDPLEAQAAGVQIQRERLIGQMLAAALVAVACIQCGDVGLFALVIPHIVRYLVGSDFRKLAVYSTIYGGIFLLVIRMVSSMIFMGDEPIPMSFIVSIVMIPLFLVLLAVGRRGFD